MSEVRQVLMKRLEMRQIVEQVVHAEMVRFLDQGKLDVIIRAAVSSYLHSNRSLYDADPLQQLIKVAAAEMTREFLNEHVEIRVK